MARYRLKPGEQIRGVTCSRGFKSGPPKVLEVRCHCKDGSKNVHKPDAVGNVVFEMTDERSCRHNDHDPRFVKIGP